MSRLRRNDSVSRVVEFASTLGYVHQWTGGGHLKFSKPGRRPVFFGGSPSDRRAHKNAISNLKKSDRGVL